MKITPDVTDDKSFFTARNYIPEHLNSKGAHLKDFNIYIQSEQTYTLTRAICTLNALEGHLNTPQKKQLLSKQLTQRTLLTTQGHSVVSSVFFDCPNKGTFPPSTNDDEFKALTSYKLRADLDEMVSKNS